MEEYGLYDCFVLQINSPSQSSGILVVPGSFAEEDLGRKGIGPQPATGNATASRGLEVAVANLQEYCNGGSADLRKTFNFIHVGENWNLLLSRSNAQQMRDYLLILLDVHMLANPIKNYSNCLVAYLSLLTLKSLTGFAF